MRDATRSSLVRGMNAALGGAIAPARPEGRCARQRLSRRAATGAEGAPRRASKGCGGFTLIELVVALTLGSVIVLMAHRILTAVIDGSAALTAARASLDREANARRLLASLLVSLDVTGDSAAFRGEPGRVTFTSWHRNARGFRARSRVSLLMMDSTLAVAGTGTDPLPLLGEVVDVELDYLLDYGARERWVREWISPASAPAAIRLRIERRAGADTLLLIIGGRG